MRKLLVPCRIGFHIHMGDRSAACVGIGVLRVLQAGISHGLDRASGVGNRISGLRRHLGVLCRASVSCRASECHRGAVLLQYLPKSHTREDRRVDYSHVPTPNTIRAKKIASGILDISTIKLPLLGLAN